MPFGIRKTHRIETCQARWFHEFIDFMLREGFEPISGA